MSDKDLLEQLGVKDMDKNTNDYLKHYGILGMKWGIRRYQPYPKGEGHKGTFIDKKKARYKKGIENNKAYQKKKKEVIGKVASTPKKAATNLAKRKADQYNKQGAKNRAQKEAVRDKVKDLKTKKSNDEVKVITMTDEELRTRLARIQMEKQYSQLTAAEKKKGQQLYEELVVKSVKTAIAGTITKTVARQIDALIKGS